MTVASTGTSEMTLKKLGKTDGKDYGVVKLKSPSHAPYYPGAEEMTVKVLYSLPEGKLLGGQILGGAGVDKRIDVLATAIHYGGNVRDLKDLEFAYAPPYANASDTLNAVGYQAEKML